jgi:hypothetical protein
MADWDYDYLVAPLGSTPTTALLDYATDVRIPEEKRARKRGRNRTIAWQQGERSTQPKLYRALDFELQILLAYTNSAGIVTHTDGAPGHVYENYLEIKRLLSGDILNGSQVTLRRTLPHAGIVDIDFEVLDEIRPDSGTRFRMVAFCRAAFPFMRSATQTVETETGKTTTTETIEVIVGGNEEIPNAVIVFAPDTQDVSNLRITHTPSGRFLQYSGIITAGDTVTIDVGARTAVHSVDGNVDAALLKAHADWLILPVGTYDLDLTCDAGTLDYDVTVSYYDLWS